MSYTYEIRYYYNKFNYHVIRRVNNYILAMGIKKQLSNEPQYKLGQLKIEKI